MKPRKSPAGTEDKDVIDHLGEFIEQNFRKGMSRMEEIFKEGLHEFIDEFINDNNELGAAISEQYLM